jgi:hypothetical protein
LSRIGGENARGESVRGKSVRGKSGRGESGRGESGREECERRECERRGWGREEDGGEKQEECTFVADWKTLIASSFTLKNESSIVALLPAKTPSVR